MAKRFPFTALTLFVILALLVALALFGLVFSRSTGRVSVDAAGQPEKVATQVETHKEVHKQDPEQTEAIYQETAKDHPDSDYALASQKDLLMSSISVKKHGQAQQIIDRLSAEFPESSELPQILYEAARKHEQTKNYQQAKRLYQQIAEQYPDSRQADRAELDIQKTTILSDINAKRDDAAMAAVDDLFADFSGHPDLPSSIYDIARRFERGKKTEQAKSLYQQIVTDYPDSAAAESARLGIAKIDIYSLIKSGGYGVTQATNSMVSGFQGHSGLSEALYDIAIRCERAKSYELSKDLYRQIIEKFPDSVHAGKARLDASKLDILSLIELEDSSSAQAALDSLITDYPGHVHLPGALYPIARCYEDRGEYEQACYIYQQIVQQFPDSSHATKARLDVQKCQILSCIDAENDRDAETAIDSLVDDFRGNQRLPWALNYIARQYYDEAQQLDNEGLIEQAEDTGQRAMAIYEIIIEQLPPSSAVPEACYTAGGYYRQRGQYEKSSECFQIIVDDYPGYHRAWNALFTIGDNYEKMGEEGLIPQAEAEPVIHAAYHRLLEEYPACPAVGYVRSRLNR